MSKQPETATEQPATDLDHLKKVIRSMFAPAASPTDADDFLLTIDISEAITPMCDFLKQELYETLTTLGFKSTTIEGNLYWLVKNQ